MTTIAQLTATIGAGHHGVLHWGDRRAPCAAGRAGVVEATDKCEGDGATPLGRWPVRRVLYRADRMDQPATHLPIRPLRADDGWCDAPEDPAYNRPVRLPYAASHEVLMRQDGLYDVIVVLGHNDDPPQAKAGSAIFFHCAKRGDGSLAGPDDHVSALNPTAGCIAIARDTLVDILAGLGPEAVMEIRGNDAAPGAPGVFNGAG